MAGQETGRRQGPLRPALWCPPTREEEEKREERGVMPFLLEVVEVHAVFPLGVVHADAGR